MISEKPHKAVVIDFGLFGIEVGKYDVKSLIKMAHANKAAVILACENNSLQDALKLLKEDRKDGDDMMVVPDADSISSGTFANNLLTKLHVQSNDIFFMTGQDCLVRAVRAQNIQAAYIDNRQTYANKNKAMHTAIHKFFAT